MHKQPDCNAQAPAHIDQQIFNQARGYPIAWLRKV